MMRWLQTFFIAICAVALAACQTVGNGKAFAPVSSEGPAALRVGVSTQTEVQRDFGTASVYRFADGSQCWTYSRTAGLPRAFQYLPYVGLIPQHVADRTQELALLFDPHGVLRKVDRRGD